MAKLGLRRDSARVPYQVRRMTGFRRTGWPGEQADIWRHAHPADLAAGVVTSPEFLLGVRRLLDPA